MSTSHRTGGRVSLNGLHRVPAYHTCSKCGERLPANAFARKEYTPTHLSYWCDQCTKAQAKRKRISNRKQQRKEARISH